MANGFTADSQGISVPKAQDVAVDVRFDDADVWSFNPARGGATGKSVRVEWPRALADRLDGVTRLSLVEHQSGEVLFERELAFGTSQQRITLVDAQGYHLVVDKGGRLQRTFAAADPTAKRALAEAAARALRDLRDECGLDAFVVYGSLLGAVRTGELIGHDSDLDLAYLSRHTNPYDIILESRAAHRKMATLGWQSVSMSAANFKVWTKLPDGRRCGIDVFGAFHIGEHFHVMGSKRGRLDRSAVLPLGEVTLEGVPMPAPADTDAFLAFLYGPGWRIPDPAFHFDHPRADVEFMDDTFRSSRRMSRYWEDFYKSNAVRQVPEEPSLFAHWVDERLPKRARLFDLGAGTGRDSVWFARQGHRVRAFDYSPAARRQAAALAERHGVALMVSSLNFEDLRTVLNRSTRLAFQTRETNLYARGLVDALSDYGRRSLWQFASMSQRHGGRTFLEFRTPTSRRERTFFPAHRRAFCDPDLVVEEIERHGGVVSERVTGRGLAPLGNEDPDICRLVVRWHK